MLDNNIAICPKCNVNVHHDKFEDMYSCMKCGIFYYPEEVGINEDKNAGYKKLNQNAVIEQ